MSRRNKGEELDMLVNLEEPLTSDTCCKLILELVKYLLYQKQQIPVTYEYLLRLKTSAGASNRSFVMSRAILECLRNISEHLNNELCRGSAMVKEIAICMGATVLSPKLCVRVTLPSGILNGRSHCIQQHSSRKPLLNLMRSMTESREFQQAMTQPLLPTNTFVLVQKSDCNRMSEFFLPKPHYTLPTGPAGSQFNIRLGHQAQCFWDCNCANLIRVYEDRDQESPHSVPLMSQSSNDAVELELKPRLPEDGVYQWYQSRDIIKGFKLSR